LAPKSTDYIHIYTYCTYLLLFFRDNGITIQILKYQLYCEGFMFLLVLFTAIIPIENDVLVYRIIGIMYSFVVFVMQPLFYLNGDVNFRNRVLQQGIWKALDRELFQRNTQIQLIAPWGKRIQINGKYWSYCYTLSLLKRKGFYTYKIQNSITRINCLSFLIIKSECIFFIKK
jgi:hypothetical protein